MKDRQLWLNVRVTADKRLHLKALANAADVPVSRLMRAWISDAFVAWIGTRPKNRTTNANARKGGAR